MLVLATNGALLRTANCSDAHIVHGLVPAYIRAAIHTAPLVCVAGAAKDLTVKYRSSVPRHYPKRDTPPNRHRCTVERSTWQMLTRYAMLNH